MPIWQMVPISRILLPPPPRRAPVSLDLSTGYLNTYFAWLFWVYTADFGFSACREKVS